MEKESWQTHSKTSWYGYKRYIHIILSYEILTIPIRSRDCPDMTSAPLTTSQFMATCQNLIPAIGNSSYSQLPQTIFECNKFSQFCHGRVEWGPEAAGLLLLYWWINYCQYQLMNRFIITLIAVHLTIRKSGWRLEAMEVMPTGGWVWWMRQLSDLTDLIH